MRKRSIITVTLFAIFGAVAWSLASTGTVMARAEKQIAGHAYSVVVKRFDHRFQTELRDGKFHVSSYAFSEDSVPPTTALITWQTLDELRITFDNGMSLQCTWDHATRDRVCWNRSIK